MPKNIEKFSHHIQNSIEKNLTKSVSERGFYLYEWLSEDELKKTIHAKYLEIMKNFSQILFFLAVGAWLLGFLAKWFSGASIAIIAIIGIFYIGIFVFLWIQMLQNGKKFTQFANISITDTHFIAGGKIFEIHHLEKQKSFFSNIEHTFFKPLFGESYAQNHIEWHKKDLQKSIENTFNLAGNFLKNVAQKSSWKNNPAIIFVFIIGFTGIIFGSMLVITYFLWLPIVAIFGKIFSKIFKKILLAKNHTEYKIQDLFENIHTHSSRLQSEKNKIIASLQDAKNQDWKDNLSAKISESFSILNTNTDKAIDKNLALKKILQNSKYKEIFHFETYNSWIKKEILHPISELLDLITLNISTLEKNIWTLKNQIENTKNPDHKAPLDLQQKRLESKKQEFLQMKNLLENYKNQLES